MVRRSAARKIEYLKNNVLSEIAVELEWVLELTPSGSSGADTALLTGPRIELCQEIAAQARDLQFQGLLVPSAALDGTNLVVIPDNLSESSMLRVVQTTEMQIDF